MLHLQRKLIPRQSPPPHFCCWDPMPGKKQQRGLSWLSLRVQSSMARETWWQEGELAGHIVPVRKQTTEGVELQNFKAWHRLPPPLDGRHLIRGLYQYQRLGVSAQAQGEGDGQRGQYTFKPHTCYCHPVYGVRKRWLTLCSLVTNDSEYFHEFFFIACSRIVFGEMSTETLCPLWSRSSYRVKRVSVHTRYFSILIICIHFPILRFVVLYWRVPFANKRFHLRKPSFCLWYQELTLPM